MVSIKVGRVKGKSGDRIKMGGVIGVEFQGECYFCCKPFLVGGCRCDITSP